MPNETFEPLADNDRMFLRTATSDAARARLLRFIRAVFAERYDADVADDSPRLVGGFDRDGALVAAFGLRDRHSGYFCEHYLSVPLETSLSERFGTSAGTASAIEITHLCATRSGCLRDLLNLLPQALLASGHRFLVCTATACLAAFFTRRGLRAVELGTASADVLPEAERARWGRYYQSAPRVLAGDLQEALALLAEPPQAAL